jgi:hypothetical protein
MILCTIDFDNPNDYDDEAFTMATINVNDAIEAAIEAGAGSDELSDCIENALKNAGAE